MKIAERGWDSGRSHFIPCTNYRGKQVPVRGGLYRSSHHVSNSHVRSHLLHRNADSKTPHHCLVLVPFHNPLSSTPHKDNTHNTSTMSGMPYSTCATFLCSDERDILAPPIGMDQYLLPGLMITYLKSTRWSVADARDNSASSEGSAEPSRYLDIHRSRDCTEKSCDISSLVYA